jgi:hypothetical protein
MSETYRKQGSKTMPLPKARGVVPGRADENKRPHSLPGGAVIDAQWQEAARYAGLNLIRVTSSVAFSNTAFTFRPTAILSGGQSMTLLDRRTPPGSSTIAMM